MIDLNKSAAWATQRATAAAAESRKSKTKNLNRSKKWAAQHQLFHERVIDACRRVPANPNGVPDTVFIAAPEHLMAKVAYLNLGSRNANSRSNGGVAPDGVTQAMRDILGDFDAEGKNVTFANLAHDNVGTLKFVLVAHGLSPISDSLLLLADLGRAFRIGRALGLPVRCMLADISWMSSNRSIRQFESLTEAEVDTGLRVCLDKRRRLYEGLGVATDLRKIARFDQSGKISGRKLKVIGERYQDLARTLWGDDVSGRLDREHVRRITKPLVRSEIVDENLPDAMRVLGQFPGVLNALEVKLKPHLEILRSVSKQFSSFDSEVFTYFFAQYYAQDTYRGQALKVAVESERKFDEPFDELDEYFQAWGEGHTTTELMLGEYEPRKTSPLSAIYLPHYRMGQWRVLPYTPLSLDALHRCRNDHVCIEEGLLCLDHVESDEKVAAVLMATPIMHRNRLLADLMSFVLHCDSHLGRQAVEQTCQHYVKIGFVELLEAGPPLLATSVEQEVELENAATVADVWLTWLKNLQTETNPSYTPPHIRMLLADADDWTSGYAAWATKLVTLTQGLYLNLI